MREKTIERRLVTQVKKAGGWALKFVSPGNAGVPDRLILLPGGRMAFVEVKAPGKKPRSLQQAVHEKLRRLGFRVHVIDRPEDIEKILNERENTGKESAV